MKGTTSTNGTKSTASFKNVHSVKRKSQIVLKLISWLLILTGILCFLTASYYFWLRTDPNRLAFQNYVYKGPLRVDKRSFPEHLIIPSVHIDLQIVPAEIKNNRWDTTDQGASYLLSSPIPGSVGNSVMYAHNWASLFGNLVNVKPGEEVDITFADKTTKKFTIEYTSTVSPDQASILAPSKDSRITLYTCTGWFDSKRFVAVAIQQ